MNVLIAVVIILACAVAVLGVQLVRSERELRRIAQFLVRRESTSNARVAVSVRTRGFVRLAQAVNRQIDRHQGERIADQDRRRAVQKGLTYLSHDIRTPLAGARGYAQLMEGEVDQVSREHYLEAIERRLDDTSQLLDQLFVYAQVQDPDYRIEREEVDANAALTEALVSLYAQFKEKGWEPQVELESDRMMVLAETSALARIFRNLGINALRYGSAAPAVVQQGSTITFSNRVPDPKTIDVDKLFERFYQSDASRSGEGSGLGLAIVSQLARAVGATPAAHLDGDVLSITLEFECA